MLWLHAAFSQLKISRFETLPLTTTELSSLNPKPCLDLAYGDEAVHQLTATRGLDLSTICRILGTSSSFSSGLFFSEGSDYLGFSEGPVLSETAIRGLGARCMA